INLAVVAHAGIAAHGSTQYLDALNSTGAAVIGNFEHRFGLNHRLSLQLCLRQPQQRSPQASGACSTTLTSIQVLRLDRGRHSSMVTISPSRQDRKSVV